MEQGHIHARMHTYTYTHSHACQASVVFMCMFLVFVLCCLFCFVLFCFVLFLSLSLSLCVAVSLSLSQHLRRTDFFTISFVHVSPVTRSSHNLSMYAGMQHMHRQIPSIPQVEPTRDPNRGCRSCPRCGALSCRRKPT